MRARRCSGERSAAAVGLAAARGSEYLRRDVTISNPQEPSRSRQLEPLDATPVVPDGRHVPEARLGLLPLQLLDPRRGGERLQAGLA
jgi:hypothetical protein